jgi:hypothetical protein
LQCGFSVSCLFNGGAGRIVPLWGDQSCIGKMKVGQVFCKAMMVFCSAAAVLDFGAPRVLQGLVSICARGLEGSWRVAIDKKASGNDLRRQKKV